MDDLGRIISIYIIQPLFIVIFLFITYKILKRNRNRLTLILSGFYISVAFAFIINAIYVPIKSNPIVYILYFITVFLILFGEIFLLIFILFLYKMNSNITTKHLITVLTLYAFLIFSILYLPNGITINEKTNWYPVWSWSFLIIVFFFTFCFLVIPFIFIFIKLYANFEDKNLKKKLKYFFIGFCGIFISFFGGMLYVTWYESFFRAIWNPILFFILIPSAILIYYGIGSEL